MSQPIHCPECQAENTPGSKFCSHCGARLPKSTSILCPRCQTPNPNSNFYCDNCGGRLHADQNNEPAKEEPSKPEASDLPTSAKMFSLPTRDPGDTGELDPASLQNWLKDQDDDSEEREDSGKLPRLSDLTPEERGKSDDLPGWLLNTDNEDLLIGSPDDITTEHFLNLIQDEEEREKLSGLLNDPTIAGDAANLPDWLRDVAQSEQNEPPTTPPTEEPQAESSEDVVDEGDDWLFELDASEGGEPQPDVSSDEAAPTPTTEDELPDWLGELDPPGTAMLGQSGAEEEPSTGPELEGEDLPDWLIDEAEDEDTPAESDADEMSDADVIADDVPDWMREDAQPDDSQDEEESPDEEEVLDDLTLDSAADTSLTGWLAEFDMEDEESEETAAEEIEAKRSLTDWLTTFDEEDLVPDEKPAETTLPEDAGEEDLPDWITEVDEAGETTETEAEEPTTPEFAAETEPTAEDDAFDWLSDLDDIEESPDEELMAEAATEEDEGLADWLDSDISIDSSLATGDTGPLPDWLDDLEPTGEEAAPSNDTGELDSTMEDLFGEKPKDATGELEWLAETEDEELAAESEEDDSSLAPLVGAAAAAGAAALAGDIGQDDEDTPEEEPDWLSELADFDPNEVVDSAEEAEEVEEEIETAVPESIPEEPATEPEVDLEVDAIFEATESADQDSFDIDDELLGADEGDAGDWADIDGILAGKGDETLPDWLEQLDEISDSEIESFDTGDLPPEEIPEWVASLRPSDTDDFASALPSALFTDSDTSELLDTGDLADGELPDWLDASSIDEKSAATDKSSSGWFSEEEMEDAAELESILADLPPAQAPEDMLQKAEIPDWLEELKPRELTGEAAPVTESRLESSGPLAGMPNTIAIEPIIAMPRAASAPGSYSISPEQVQQARLLQQLVQEGPPPPQVGEAAISARGLAGLRILVAILLLAAVAIGLYGPSILKSKSPASVPTPAAAVNTAVSDAAGETVLVAFEYTPALAAELDPEAKMLLAQINANGSSILTTSQYAAGTAVAKAMTEPYDVLSLGLIPGEAIGLRQLGSCLGEDNQVSTCTIFNDRALNDETAKTMAEAMADVGLVVLFTGERSSLVNWVEQVGASSDIPIIIGTTQSLEPVVVPYFATTQVAGYINGLPATVAYQQAYTDLDDTTADVLYDAQSLILLVTAVILLIGGMIFGLRRKNS
jgi:hypothetical protein